MLATRFQLKGFSWYESDPLLSTATATCAKVQRV
jgi:hypothetical protein